MFLEALAIPKTIPAAGNIVRIGSKEFSLFPKSMVTLMNPKLTIGNQVIFTVLEPFLSRWPGKSTTWMFESLPSEERAKEKEDRSNRNVLAILTTLGDDM